MTTTYRLGDEAVTIGRGGANTVPLADIATSSKHCQLVKDANGWQVEDRGSLNGTLVNGQRVSSARLKDGDRILLGATEILFEDRGGGSSGVESGAGSALGSSFLQSILTDDATGAPSATASSLLQSLVIDDSPEVEQPGEQRLEFVSVDGGLGAAARRQTLLLDPKHGKPVGSQIAVAPRRPGESLADVKLRLIQRVGEKLVRIFDPKQLMDEIMSIVIEQTGADRGLLCLLDERRMPVPIAARGLEDGQQVRVSGTVLRRLLSERAGVLINPSATPGNLLASLEAMQVVSTLCVPLWTGDNIIGVLSLDSTRPEKTFTEEDLELLLAVAHQAALGIERGRLSQLVESERQVRMYLSKYLDNAIVQRISETSGETDPLAPAERVVTVLFSDIVSFTKISEGLEPAELAGFIREYLTAMTDIVFAHGGTIDKYIGDAVMALFGAPVASPESSAAAIRAALDMRDRLRDFKPPGGGKGVLRARFGINTGRVVVGNIGSARRMEYTAIGDTVNVASRLQTFARPNEICIDEVTHAQTGGAFVVEEVGAIDVKNRAQAVLVYKVLRAK